MKKYTKRPQESIVRAGVANKGRKHSEEHKEHISQAKKNSETKDKVVCIQKIEGGEILIFKSFAAAARYIGCSKQLTSQAAKDRSTFSARGYIVRLLPIAEAYEVTTLI